MYARVVSGGAIIIEEAAQQVAGHLDIVGLRSELRVDQIQHNALQRLIALAVAKAHALEEHPAVRKNLHD